jgi:hypothetical protein
VSAVVRAIPATAEEQQAFTQIAQPKTTSELVVVNIHELLSKELPPREEILSPWMLSQSLNMIYAWRGVGKTHVALGIAYAIATGGEFLGWKAQRPRGVLYIDGEMPAAALQERLAAIVVASDVQPEVDLLQIITPDLQPNFTPIPDLGTPEGQEQIDRVIDERTELIIVDNLSSVVRHGGRENEAESWLSVQGWALSKRAQGKSVLFIHHAGKNGGQRGTSKREDLLDTVICLKQTPDYEPTMGACFEVHFEKSRNQHGEEVAPFEARLTQDVHGKRAWTTRSVVESTFDKVVALAKDGLKQHEVATELEVNRSTVSRHWRKAQGLGLISKGTGNE